ncbi:MAG: hypothetical protein B6I38_05885 [Anaerolineaceae bacterium 4572_5.1]|nr:MAG: hypothetical protein B6I38_05885 [Anaerolineaceae bacterium 4572_5.1]
MTYPIAQWPFLAPEERTPEESERWWTACYLPPPADITLRGVSRSVIVSGQPGSGKTTLLKAFERDEAKRYLMVRYPVPRWPGEEHAWVKGYGHLGQIMACASMAVKKFLTAHPDKLTPLSKINREYLRWLIEKHSGRRAVQRWADALNFQPLLAMLEHPFDDIYPTDSELQDVQGQIEELVTLSRRLGFEGGLAILVDVDNVEAANEVVLAKMKDLFGWLTPLQFEGFAIKAAIPEKAIEKANLVYKSRGRVSFASLRWAAELCYELGNRHLQAATNQQLTALVEIASKELLTTLEDEFQTVYGAPSPQVLSWLTKTLLDGYAKRTKKLTKNNFNELIRIYFANYVPLRFDRTRRGVWQGALFTPLDDQPFSFFEVLWQNKNVGDANQALFKIAGSQGNLNTIASRLRKKIEPVPKQPIYVCNTRSQGYWLENVVDVDI